MATYELYVGGPSTTNYSRAMFPAPTFSAAGAAFVAMKPAAHKGPYTFNLGRTLDAAPLSNLTSVGDAALAEFLRNTTIVQGDVLGVQVIPRRVVIEGFFYEVERAVGAATVLTPALRGVAGATLPTIDANVVGSGFCRLGGAAWLAANAAINEGVGAGLEGEEWYMHTPAMLDLTLTTLSASKLGNLRMSIVPLVRSLESGAY